MALADLTPDPAPDPAPDWPAPALIILDCDGVLVDSEWIAERTITEELAAAGVTLAPGADGTTAATRYRGMSIAEMVTGIETETGRPLPPDFLARLWRRDRAAFERDLEAVPGARHFARGLTLPFCVASSGTLAKMHHSLGLCGLLDLFEGRLYSAQQVARGKPAPDLFLFAAQQMGAAPGDCLVIEDSVNGVRAARAAAMRVFGFMGGRHADAALAEALTAAGAERVVRGWQDISLLPPSSP